MLRDQCRPAAGGHRDFLQLGATNGLARPGGATMLGSPVDLSLVDRDVDERAHRRMVNPPGNEKARYQVAKDCPEDPREWLRHAESCRASWWPHYAGRLAERSGDETAAPDELGGGRLAALSGAPGTYVYDR